MCCCCGFVSLEMCVAFHVSCDCFPHSFLIQEWRGIRFHIVIISFAFLSIYFRRCYIKVPVLVRVNGFDLKDNLKLIRNLDNMFWLLNLLAIHCNSFKFKNHNIVQFLRNQSRLFLLREVKSWNKEPIDSVWWKWLC